MSMYGEKETRIVCGKGVAKQAMRDECDVNLIMAKFVKTGFISHVAAGLPSYVDVSELSSYREAIEHVRSVEGYFAGLPANVRSRFGNDAVAFMEYLDSGASEDDLRALGLDVLGDRRARAQDGREGDGEVPDVVAAALPEGEAAAGTLST